MSEPNWGLEAGSSGNRKSNFDSETDLKLIEYVKQHPILYKKFKSQKLNYIKVDTREYLWSEFAKSIGKTTKECERRWKNMRYQYNAGKKSLKWKSKFEYHLKFLDTIVIGSKGRRVMDNEMDDQSPMTFAGFISSIFSVSSTSPPHVKETEDNNSERVNFTNPKPRQYYGRKNTNHEKMPQSSVSNDENSAKYVNFTNPKPRQYCGRKNTNHNKMPQSSVSNDENSAKCVLEPNHVETVVQECATSTRENFKDESFISDESDDEIVVHIKVENSDTLELQLLENQKQSILNTKENPRSESPCSKIEIKQEHCSNELEQKCSRRKECTKSWL